MKRVILYVTAALFGLAGVACSHPLDENREVPETSVVAFNESPTPIWVDELRFGEVWPVGYLKFPYPDESGPVHRPYPRQLSLRWKDGRGQTQDRTVYFQTPIPEVDGLVIYVRIQEGGAIKVSALRFQDVRAFAREDTQNKWSSLWPKALWSWDDSPGVIGDQNATAH